jgi:hypothetical protein
MIRPSQVPTLMITYEARTVGSGYGAPKSRQAEKKHPQQQKHYKDGSGIGSHVDVREWHAARTSKALI